MTSFLDAPIIHSRSTGIDFLRGLLALWVLLAHSMPWAAYVKGNIEQSVVENGLSWLVKIFQGHGETHPAVLGFIVLSGYCIHRNGARRVTGFSIKNYAWRRFFRIWPVYIIAIVVGLLCYFAYSSIDQVKAVAISGTPAINWACLASKFFGTSVFFAPLHACSFQGNAPLNTAMVEIWLYVLYAVVVARLIKGWRDSIIIAAIGLAYFLGLLFVSTSPNYLPWWNNGSVFSFAVYWWIGAKFVIDRPIKMSIILITLAAWLLLTFAFIIQLTDNIIVVEIRKILLAILFGAVISSCDRTVRGWYKTLSQVGLFGYSLYALHAPLLILLLILGINVWAAMILVVGVAAVVYKFFEKPMIEFGRLGPGKTIKAQLPC